MTDDSCQSYLPSFPISTYYGIIVFFHYNISKIKLLWYKFKGNFIVSTNQVISNFTQKRF